MDYTKIIGFLGTAGVAVFFTHLFTKNKQNAEIQNILSKTYLDIIEGMRLEIERLSNRVAELETEIKHLKPTACNPKPFLRKV